MFRAVLGALLVVCANVPAHAGGRVLVVSKGLTALQVYDADKGTMEFEVKGAGEPHVVAVSADGKHAYIGDAKGMKNTIQVVDLDQRSVAQTLNLAPYIQPHGLVLSHDGSKLYATCAPNRAVVEIDLASMKMTRAFKFSVDSVENIALTPDEKLIFASSSFDGSLPVIDVTKGEMERMIMSGNNPEGLAVSPDGKELWVANRVSQTIAVIDIPTRKRVAQLPCIGNPMQVYFNDDGSQVFITLAVADRIAVFNRAKRTETTRFEVGDFPVCMAFGDTDKIAYVACGEGASVSVVDLAAHKVLRKFSCGADPEGIAYTNK
jgi:YVTN family beta-propeller protein